jgi:hypothetical protein
MIRFYLKNGNIVETDDIAKEWKKQNGSLMSINFNRSAEPGKITCLYVDLSEVVAVVSTTAAPNDSGEQA